MAAYWAHLLQQAWQGSLGPESSQELSLLETFMLEALHERARMLQNGMLSAHAVPPAGIHISRCSVLDAGSTLSAASPEHKAPSAASQLDRPVLQQGPGSCSCSAAVLGLVKQVSCLVVQHPVLSSSG